MMPSLHEMTEWTDFDLAMYSLALTLGLMDESSGDPMGPLKWIWWSNNPLGNLLGEILTGLVECHVLEENEAGQYRWNPKYRTDCANAHARQVLAVHRGMVGRWKGTERFPEEKTDA